MLPILTPTLFNGHPYIYIYLSEINNKKLLIYFVYFTIIVIIYFVLRTDQKL